MDKTVRSNVIARMIMVVVRMMACVYASRAGWAPGVTKVSEFVVNVVEKNKEITIL